MRPYIVRMAVYTTATCTVWADSMEEAEDKARYGSVVADTSDGYEDIIDVTEIDPLNVPDDVPLAYGVWAR